MIPLPLQTTAPETTTPPQRVELSPEQMAQIGDQINGAAYWVSGFLAVGIFALGIVMLVVVLGGR